MRQRALSCRSGLTRYVATSLEDAHGQLSRTDDFIARRSVVKIAWVESLDEVDVGKCTPAVLPWPRMRRTAYHRVAKIDEYCHADLPGLFGRAQIERCDPHALPASEDQ